MIFRGATIVIKDTSIAQADSGHIQANGDISLSIIFNLSLVLLNDDPFIPLSVKWKQR